MEGSWLTVMQTHNSRLSVGGHVDFPEWRGERHYMLPFTVAAGLPKNLGRFQKTVDQMMEGVRVDRNQECYIMIDEKEVIPGEFHRRPGMHVDGYWWAPVSGHDGHRSSCHSDTPYWSPVPQPSHKFVPQHRGLPYRHRGCSPAASEGLLLASNYSSARALVGEYRRDFINDWRGGDCSELSLQGLDEVMLQANRSYHMDVMTLHESLPILENVKRTLVRINVPNWNN